MHTPDPFTSTVCLSPTQPDGLLIEVSLLCIVRSDGLFFMIPKGENIGSCVSTGIRTWVNQLT